jgi:hypothetical protein
MIIVKTINLSPTRPINYIRDKFCPIEMVTKETLSNERKEFGELLLGLSIMMGVPSPTNEMKEKIWDAFMPIIEVIQGISLPLSFVVLATAICLIILGQKRQGMQMAKWGVIGFLAMQWLPSFMRILAEVGEAMAR